jgi:hypothetical protein
MGLDTFFRFMTAPGDTAPKLDLTVKHLCGGMFSGDNDGSSFRGKVYDDIVEEATGGGHTLYEELTSPEIVRKIADALAIYLNENPDRKVFGQYGCNREEIVELQKVFDVYGNASAIMVGWW